MVNDEILAQLKKSCDEFTMKIKEQFDFVTDFDTLEVKHLGNRFQISLAGLVKETEPHRDKLIYMLAQHAIPPTVLEEVFTSAGRELKIYDMDINSKPIIVEDVNTKERFRLTVNNVKKILSNAILNANTNA